MRLRRQNTAPADADAHYRALSGARSREKKARRAILSSLRGAAGYGEGAGNNYATGNNYTTSTGNNYTTSTGNNYTTSTGNNYTSSTGNNYTASTGNNYTTSTGNNYTSSTGNDYTSSTGNDYTTSTGNDYTTSTGNSTPGNDIHDASSGNSTTPGNDATTDGKITGSGTNTIHARGGGGGGAGADDVAAPLLGLSIEDPYSAAEGRRSSSSPSSPSPPPSSSSAHKKHSWVYRLLSGRSRHAPFVLFNRFLAAVILVNVVAFVCESFPELGRADSPYADGFYGIEAVSSSIFLVEWFARMWTVPESRWYRNRYGVGRACGARARYFCTLRSAVDLASSLPFFVELCIPGHDLPTFTWLRLFRLFRILKSERSVRAFSSVYRVVWYNSEILGIALFIGCLLMMATSTLLWYLQPPDAAGDQFDSIPATFYLSILMLTGQGTPDGVLPWYTKLVVMLTAVFSVPIFVIPSSMLTWGFEAEADLVQKLFLEGRRDEAILAVPDQFADEISLCGSIDRIKDRLQAWKDSPVTTLMINGDENLLRQMAELVL